MLALLGLGVAGFAALGQAQSPGLTPERWVQGVLAATAAAGSAHLHFSSVTTVSSPLPDSVTTGTGVVDFRRGSYRVTQLFRDRAKESTNGGPPRAVLQTWKEESIAIGQSIFTRLEEPPPFPASGWAKARFPRSVHQALGLDAGTAAEQAMSGLALITPVTSVRMLGPGRVRGIATTRYVVTSEPLYVCGAHGDTVLVEQVGPTTLWIDSQDRLLQVRAVQHLGVSAAPKVTQPSTGSGIGIAGAPTTTTTTLTFSGFGAPVTISAPQLGGGANGSSVVILKSKASSKPCNR
jgi:hypothetical protein